MEDQRLYYYHGWYGSRPFSQAEKDHLDKVLDKVTEQHVQEIDRKLVNLVKRKENIHGKN